MPIRVERYETTPNPNALKCWLSRPISEVPRSFLNAEMAAADPLATRLFEQAGITNLYINGDWMTISKPPDADWAAVKRRVEEALESSEAPPTGRKA